MPVGAPAGVGPSAGVTVRAGGTGAAAGADASLTEVADGRAVGVGSGLDWKYRVEVGAGGSGAGGSGAAAAGLGAPDTGTESAVPGGVVPQTVVVSACTAPLRSRLRPHAWQVVWLRKISVAPQAGQVAGRESGPNVISVCPSDLAGSAPALSGYDWL